MTKYKWHKDFNPTYEDGFAHGYEAYRAEQALEQPAQEPVAWVKDNLICPENNYETTRTEEHPKDLGWTPLYSHPAPQPAQEPVSDHEQYMTEARKAFGIAPSWQGLSDDELDALNGSPMALEHSSLYKFARAIEQALKEKNNAM